MIYFASDLHLGVPNYESSKQREKHFVRWLDEKMFSATEFYLVGDIFDFWFEYKKVVPKGYLHLLGKLAQIREKGIPITIIKGNHDLWYKDYFMKELSISVYHHPITREFSGKKFYIAHGDGLGPGDKGYKFIKKCFQNRLLQWCFGMIHPDWGISLANFLSASSRHANAQKDKVDYGEKEVLIQYSNQMLEIEHFDYFIYGHRHIPKLVTLKNNQSLYINLGDWITTFTYAVFDGQKVHLETYPLS
ncbi:MAG: UDP-2,3-diacylglucosamine diphosphatase [Bacteroidia bacterium]|nr:UDP-2,3-diacylglucosamine diphosphatase [Bacteroidia bacterium]